MPAGPVPRIQKFPGFVVGAMAGLASHQRPADEEKEPVMKTLLIAALATAGLMTCACTSQGAAAGAPAAAAPHATTVTSQPGTGRHHHRHHPAVSQGQPPAPSGGSGAPAGPAAGGSSSGGAAPAAQAAAAPPPCLSRYLGAKPGISQGGLGSTYVAIVFKNLNSAPCTLYGYPGVSLAGGKPVTQIGRAAIENPATPRTLVTLAPGGVANALLRIVAAGNYPAAKCGPATAHWLQIFPPNQTVPIYLYYTAPACTQPVPLLTVNTVRPGSGG
jgi:hypothetical protein